MLYVIGIIVGAAIVVLGCLFGGFLLANFAKGQLISTVLNFVIAVGMIFLGIYIISSTVETMNVVDAAQQIINTLN